MSDTKAPPAPIAWSTVRTKDGKQTLQEEFIATNPRYVEVHKEWDWEPKYAAPQGEGA